LSFEVVRNSYEDLLKEVIKKWLGLYYLKGSYCPQFKTVCDEYYLMSVYYIKLKTAEKAQKT